MDKIELLRKEFQSYTFRSNLKMIKGNTCVNCGKDDIVEYHHIVPLILGGTNNLDNIVPLCCECHDKAHTKYDDLKELGIRRSKLAGVEFGRKRTVVLNSETINILHKYFNLEIGTAEAKSLLGIPVKNKSTWDRIRKEYKSIFDIPDNFRNNIDIKNSQSKKQFIDKKITYTDEVENILHKYFNNQIGLKEARALIGLTNKTQTTWYRLVDTYKSKFIVPEGFKNLIDLHNSQEQRIATGKKTILNNKLKIFKV